MEVYDTIKLPNGGTIQMDKLAYETMQGTACSNYKGTWTYTIDFSDSKIETATKPQLNKQIELR